MSYGHPPGGEERGFPVRGKVSKLSESQAAWTRGVTQEELAFRVELTCGGSQLGALWGPLEAVGQAETPALIETPGMKGAGASCWRACDRARWRWTSVRLSGQRRWK